MPLIDSILDFTRRLGAPRVVGLLLVTGAGVGAMWGLIAWGNKPEMVPLVANATMQTIVEARDALQANGSIDWELGAGGAELLVPAEQLAEARVQLAQAGISIGDRPGFELFDEPSWGMTDFTQRINYRRALEGELERSIGQMRGIRAAEVHLAMREGSVYQRANQPVEASVLLRLGSGARPTSQQIEAITYLLASAVDGLNSDGVSVLDDSGRLLSSAEEPNSPGRMSRRQLEVQMEVEERLESSAAEILDPMVGAGNVRVTVTAELNHEEVQTRTDSVDPNEQILTAEERSEIEPGDPSQGAASSISAQTFEASRTTQVSTRAAGEIKRLTVAVALNEDLPRAGDPALLANIEQLVARAVGLDETRGDAISVLAVPFEAPGATISADPAPAGGGVLDLIREFQRPAILVFALVLAFVLAMRGLSLARTALPEPAALRSGDRSATQLTGADGSPGLPGGIAGDVIVGGPAPDASRVVRAWLGEG